MGNLAGNHFISSWRGFCPICKRDTVFEARGTWFRDNLICTTCPGGSIPRERAVMVVLDDLVPDWRQMAIHESSPCGRGVSVILAHECSGYVQTQYFRNIQVGSIERGVRCENLEKQTFADEKFDIVITQDVMEHVFAPDQAYREIFRTLKPGGLYIHTTPIYKGKIKSERRASLNSDGSVQQIAEPEYHGNPIDKLGSLVTFHYGYDLGDLITEWTPFEVEIRRSTEGA